MQLQLQLQHSHHHLRSPSPPPAIVLPPSEDEMAAWLYPIVRGDDELVFTADQDDQPGGHAAAGVDDGQQAALVKGCGGSQEGSWCGEEVSLSPRSRSTQPNRKGTVILLLYK
jgi:hypothetical protein